MPTWRELLFGCVGAVVGAVALAMGVIGVHAQQFPYREPGPYRTAFVESVSRACVRANLEYQANVGIPKEANVGIPKEKVFWFCDCKAITLATFITAQDVKDADEGGMHATARTDALEQKAEAGCLNVLTGNHPR
jgi:hypothetical protein